MRLFGFPAAAIRPDDCSGCGCRALQVSAGRRGVYRPARGEDAQATVARAAAPRPGAVTNLNLSPERYLAPGQAALTFIDGRAYWVSAPLRENNLEHMLPGTVVEMVFDALPGRVFAGRVESIGCGLGGTAPVDQATGLLSPNKPNNEPGFSGEPVLQ